MSQLSSKKRARIVVQGSVIFIETSPKKKKWRLSTKIFDHEGSFPARMQGSLSSLGVLKWQERGAYLKMDPEIHSLFLIQEIESSAKYIPFKYLMKDFVKVAQEWKEVFEEFSTEQRQHH